MTALIKKGILIISLTYVVYFFWFLFFRNDCYLSGPCQSLELMIKIIFIVGYPLLGVFPLSIASFKMSEWVFDAWCRFICFSVPVVSFILYMLSQMDSSFYGGGFGSGVGRAFIFGVGATVPFWILVISLRVVMTKKRSIQR
jgi:hypothetical protein